MKFVRQFLQLLVTFFCITALTFSARSVTPAHASALPSITYTVTYDGNGSDGGTLPTDSTNYNTGDTVHILFGPLPTKTGYTFGGWSDGSTFYSSGLTDTFTMGSSNVTLTAQWAATFNYTGAEQTYTVPADVCYVTVDAYGAAGGVGSGYPGSRPPKGGGGRLQYWALPVTAGETLYIYVGGAGGNASGGFNGGAGGSGGFNGGGDGGDGGSTTGGGGGGGGGASDVRQGGNSVDNQVILAGGGGGSGGGGGNNNTLEGVGGQGGAGQGKEGGTRGGYYPLGDPTFFGDGGSASPVPQYSAIGGWGGIGGQSPAINETQGYGGSVSGYHPSFAFGAVYVPKGYGGHGEPAIDPSVGGGGGGGGGGHIIPVLNSSGGGGGGSGNPYISGGGSSTGGGGGGGGGYLLESWLNTNNMILTAGVRWGNGLVTLMPINCTHTVTYDGSGGVGSLPAGGVYFTGSTVNVQFSPLPTKTGYTFAGWSDGSTTYTSGSSTSFSMGSSNVTLWAQWTAINYTVSYDGNGNDGGSLPTDSANYNINNTVTVKFSPLPTKTGYTFAGWSDGSTTYTSGGTTSFAMGSSNVTLMAQWAAVPPTATATATATSTPIPPTATVTATKTPVPPTATATATNTPIPPTVTATVTRTPIPSTVTATATNTPVPPTATATVSKTPVPSTATSTATATPTVNLTPVTVTINQATGQSDPTSTRLLSFTAVFSEAVSGFTSADVSVSPSVACAPVVTVTGSGTTYNVALTSMNKECTVTVSLAAGVVNSVSRPAAVNAASTSTDNSQSFAYAVKSYASLGANDGWILESASGSNIGGSVNSSALTLSVGDDSANRSYRMLSSFDTSTDPVPAAAVIAGINYRVIQSSITGTNPLTTHGSLRTYLNAPFFGTNASLEAGDYQAAADTGACIFDTTLLSGSAYRCLFYTVALPFFPKSGVFDLRSHFDTGDANNSTDLLNITSGNAAGNRPQVFVTYYFLP